MPKKSALEPFSAAAFLGPFCLWGKKLLPRASGRRFRNSSPEGIEENVTSIGNRACLDGQQNECLMKLRVLHTSAKAFSNVPAAIFPQPVEYPNTPASGVR